MTRDGLSPEVRRLVAELVAAELLDVAAEMSADGDLCKAGAWNRKRGGASQRQFEQGLDMAEACHVAASKLARHAQIRSGRWRPVPGWGPKARTPETGALFELDTA